MLTPSGHAINIVIHLSEVSILNIIRQTKSLRRFGITKYINKGAVVVVIVY